MPVLCEAVERMLLLACTSKADVCGAVGERSDWGAAGTCSDVFGEVVASMKQTFEEQRAGRLLQHGWPGLPVQLPTHHLPLLASSASLKPAS